VVRLSLATALADQGRPDEACAVAGEVVRGCSVHPDFRAGWVVHAVSELDHHVEPYQGMRAVQEFPELVRSTTAGA
jgi:hypothetical protein